MKQAAFGTRLKSLMFREFYLGRKDLIASLVMSVLMIVMAFLLKLSFEYGNLAKLSAENLEIVEENLQVYICYLPAFAMSVAGTIISTSAARDEIGLWHRFRCSTPAAPQIYALAKYACLLLVILAGMVLSIGYFALIGWMDGNGIQPEYIAVMIAMQLLCTSGNVLMQVMTMVFRSMDKAGIFVTGVGFCAAIPFVYTATVRAETEDPIDFQKIEEFCVSVLPLTPLLLLVVIGIGFLVTWALLKRREK